MNAKKMLGWLGFVAVALVCLAGPVGACEIVKPAFNPMYNDLIEFCPGPALLDLDSGWDEVEVLVPCEDGSVLKLKVVFYVGWEC